MLAREEWNRGPGSPFAVLVYRCVQDAERGWDPSLWATLGWKAQHLSRKICYEIQINVIL